MIKQRTIGLVMAVAAMVAACSTSASDDAPETSEDRIEVAPNELVYVGKYKNVEAATESAPGRFVKLTLDREHGYVAELPGGRSERGIWFVRGNSTQMTLSIVADGAEPRSFRVKTDKFGNLVLFDLSGQRFQALRRVFIEIGPIDPVCGCFDPLVPDCCSPNPPTTTPTSPTSPTFPLDCACLPGSVPTAPPGSCCGL